VSVQLFLWNELTATRSVGAATSCLRFSLTTASAAVPMVRAAVIELLTWHYYSNGSKSLTFRRLEVAQ
jgi:hypothetical protein